MEIAGILHVPLFLIQPTLFSLAPSRKQPNVTKSDSELLGKYEDLVCTAVTVKKIYFYSLFQ